MARQHIDYTTSANSPPNNPTDDGLDTGEANDLAVRPIIDGEPAQGAVFKRPSENLRTRTEVIRAELEALKFLSDADKAMLLTSSGDITWNGVGTGTFVPTANLILQPFLSPLSSAASRLKICDNTQAQITIRTRQNGASGQPRAYNGANEISIDFQPVTVGTGAIIVTATGVPANNVHVQYDDHPVSGTTASLNALTGFIQQFNASSIAIGLGLEAVSEGTGTPIEYGFPTPPGYVAASLLDTYISAPEQATRFMSGAADAEKHIITPGNLTSFFGADGGTLNKLIEGDVLCVWYDALVDDPPSTYGGRRQSLSEAPESSSTIPAGSLFMLRRFTGRLPGALPLATVQNGKLIFVNGRVYGSGETGPLVSSGASYQGSGTWVNSVPGIAAGSFEAAVDAIVAQLALTTVPSGAARIGASAITGIGAGSIQSQLQGLSDAIIAGGGDVSAHLLDPTDAHDASAISNVAAGTIAATDVQAAINELDGDVQAHLSDTTDAHDATAISNVPAGTIAATTAQAAINELDGDIQAHLSDGSDAHAASALTNTPAGNIAATTVQAALNELDSEKGQKSTTNTWADVNTFQKGVVATHTTAGGIAGDFTGQGANGDGLRAYGGVGGAQAGGRGAFIKGGGNTSPFSPGLVVEAYGSSVVTSGIYDGQGVIAAPSYGGGNAFQALSGWIAAAGGAFKLGFRYNSAITRTVNFPASMFNYDSGGTYEASGTIISPPYLSNTYNGGTARAQLFLPVPLGAVITGVELAASNNDGGTLLFTCFLVKWTATPPGPPAYTATYGNLGGGGGNTLSFVNGSSRFVSMPLAVAATDRTADPDTWFTFFVSWPASTSANTLDVHGARVTYTQAEVSGVF